MLGATPAAPAAVGHLSSMDKSAKTRFNNDRVAAKKQGLQGAAAQALKYKKSGSVQPQVQPVEEKRDFSTMLPSFKAPGAQPMNQGPSELPLEAPQMPDQMIDPQAEFQAQLDLNELFDSAEFKDSMTKVHLVNYFKGQKDNPETFALQALANLAPKQ